MSETLDFELLEDIMSLPTQQISQIVQNSKLSYISPIVEFAYHNYNSSNQWLENLPNNPIVTDLIKLSAITNIEASNNPINSFAKTFEFIRTPQNEDEIEDNKWEAFLLRAEKAASLSGVEKPFAKTVIKTLGEMVDNIIWHSEKTETGIVGYQWFKGHFEYVVADSGIGVLNSLRRCSQYSNLQNSGDALSIAIKNGETRFGRNSRRGTGFNNLVLNIAKRCSLLRFRSGNHSLTFDGITSYLNQTAPTPKIRTCANFNGFLISVSCKTPNQKE